MKDTATFPALALIKECVMYNFHGQPTKTRGYMRKFVAKYVYSYIDDKGDRIFQNMQMNVCGFNEIARFMKAEFADGDTVRVAGILTSYDTEYAVETAIEVLNMDDMVKLPKINLDI